MASGLQGLVSGRLGQLGLTSLGHNPSYLGQRLGFVVRAFDRAGNCEGLLDLVGLRQGLGYPDQGPASFPQLLDLVSGCQGLLGLIGLARLDQSLSYLGQCLDYADQSLVFLP